MLPKITSCVCLLLYFVALPTEGSIIKEKRSLDLAGGQLVEEGRTLVHHAMKRFMIILPAIFFKLGIAFTVLILVALAVVNNGFVGFLILVVGLSGVLARLQRPQHQQYVARVPTTLAVQPLIAAGHHHQVWDRSGGLSAEEEPKNKMTSFSYGGGNDYHKATTGTGGYNNNYYAKYTSD